MLANVTPSASQHTKLSRRWKTSTVNRKSQKNNTCNISTDILITLKQDAQGRPRDPARISANAWCCQARPHRCHQVRSACHIPPPRGQGAAGILDQAAHDKVWDEGGRTSAGTSRTVENYGELDADSTVRDQKEGGINAHTHTYIHVVAYT
jgi:hypothetical protein